MARDGLKVNIAASRPEDFIPTEIIEESAFSVTRAAQILGVTRAALSRLLSSTSSFPRY